jgi:hypothetical protein
MIHLQDVHSFNGFCNSWQKTQCLKQRFHSWMNCASPGLGSPNIQDKPMQSDENHVI